MEALQKERRCAVCRTHLVGDDVVGGHDQDVDAELAEFVGEALRELRDEGLVCVCVCVCVCVMGGWNGGSMDGWMNGWGQEMVS
jgi:hypothetical protein